MSDPAATAAYQDDPGFSTVMLSYGMRQEAIDASVSRLIDIMVGLAKQLHVQQGKGSTYFVGDRVSATDIHWACLSQMILPLPHE